MPPATLPLHSFIENWRKPAGLRAAAVIFTIEILLAAVTAIVYYTGGTSFSWLHLMYVPIIIAAAVFRISGGVTAALAAGLLIGPWMPLYVPEGIPQETANWLFRIFFFLIAAILTGLLGEVKQTTLKSHRISNCISDSSTGFFLFRVSPRLRHSCTLWN